MEVAQVQVIYQEQATGLQRFLLGVLRDEAAAADAMQATFVKLLEKGNTVEQLDSLKSWLYRVAFNEAMLIRRRQSMRLRHAEDVAWFQRHRRSNASGAEGESANWLEGLIRQENMEQVRFALNQLNADQRDVVYKRIFENQKFREIAEETGVPLGTVLARMQASLKKLKTLLAPVHESIDQDD